MQTRKEYVEQLKNKLDEWNADIGAWEEKARSAKNDLTIEYEMRMDDLRKKRDAATDKLKELQASSEEAFKELKTGADAAWAAMREAFDKARTHFQK
jgi:uncharacterized coiled-coil DUF342 family protein